MAQRVGRRALLQSTAVGIAGLAGCTTFGDQSTSQTPKFIDLTAINLHDAPHTAHVRLELDGETVYRESKQMAASELDHSRGAVFSEYPTTAEPYVLSAWRDDRPETDARTLDFASFDTECLAVQLMIGTYGRNVETPRLAIYYGFNCSASS
ncbi:hypothetical protein [Salinarchaeum laminariae]|uniref:hypothetical protein n=1 Tax=Salinarchaeum laminariae TaxID=869888 RepID=UPI0020BF882A|nr:hypothetical protein [Salinarchaeum laminariae]